MTKGVKHTLYYSLREIANRTGVTKDWLHRQVSTGQLPRRWFGKFYVLHDDDLPTIDELRAHVKATGRLPTPRFIVEPIEVAYTVERAAAMAGVGVEFVRNLAETGKIDAQRFGVGWMIFPSAIAQIKAAPQTTARLEPLPYRTSVGNPMQIPPLTDRQKYIATSYLAGKSFAEIGRELGVSRERPSKTFAIIKQRVLLLQARGHADVAGIATQLGVDENTATQLIALVQHVD